MVPRSIKGEVKSRHNQNGRVNIVEYIVFRYTVGADYYVLLWPPVIH